MPPCPLLLSPLVALLSSRSNRHTARGGPLLPWLRTQDPTHVCGLCNGNVIRLRCLFFSLASTVQATEASQAEHHTGHASFCFFPRSCLRRCVQSRTCFLRTLPNPPAAPPKATHDSFSAPHAPTNSPMHPLSTTSPTPSPSTPHPLRGGACIGVRFLLRRNRGFCIYTEFCRVCCAFWFPLHFSV